MPRAKKPATKTDKKVVAKKIVKKKIEPKIDLEAIKEELRKEIQEQIQEAILNIEIDVPEPVVQAPAKNTEATLSRSTLTLEGKNRYTFVSDLDGLVISELDKNLLTLSNTGAVGIGTKAPRSSGIGSMHIRANYTSEAPMPTTGLGSTRGLIVEGDGDDAGSYIFRGVSRGNRQGLNLTSDGQLRLGAMDDVTESTLAVIGKENDTPKVTALANSRYFNSDVLNLQTKAPNSDRFNFISAKADTVDSGKNGLEVFKVDGEGSVHTETGYFSNSTGYAELFEWADGNQKNEDRTGITVTLNSEGQLVVADEGDTVLGVIVENAAVVGDAGWNAWENKYQLKENKNPSTKKYKIVEWVDDEGILQSFYLNSLSKEFALPEDAIIYETYDDGSDMHLKVFNDVFDIDRPFIPKLKRGWAIVVLVGRVNMWKGQLVEKHWFKIADINDDIEQWILR